MMSHEHADHLQWISKATLLQRRVDEAEQRIAGLEQQLAAANARAWCDACAGTGKQATGTCMCGGTGLAQDAGSYLRDELLVAKKRAEQAELRIAALEVEARTAWENGRRAGWRAGRDAAAAYMDRLGFTNTDAIRALEPEGRNG